MPDAPVFDMQKLNLSAGGKWPGFLGSIGQGYRAKVPGGWLVFLWDSCGVGLTFYPDPQHKWDGGTLPGEKG
jgi:hypothetical protein